MPDIARIIGAEGVGSKCIDLNMNEISDELFPYPKLPNQKAVNGEFLLCFNDLLAASRLKPGDLCKAALVSDRMMRHIRNGRHLAKESVLALLVAMELELPQIQAALQKTGYILTKSLPGDAVVIWMLENVLYKHSGSKRVFLVNDELEEFNLPLLMTKLRD